MGQMMDRSDLPFVRLIVPMPDGSHFSVFIRVDEYITIGRVMVQLCPTPEDRMSMMQSVSTIALAGGTVIRQAQVTEEEHRRIFQTLFVINTHREHEKWANASDPVMSAIYHLLNQRIITRGEAAQIATLEMGLSADGTDDQEKDAVRKRLDRWIVKRGLDPIGQPKRSPRKRLNGRKRG